VAQFTARQEEEIKEQFARREKRQWLIILLFLPCVLVIGMASKGGQVLGIAGESLVVPAFIARGGAAICSVWNWRCPGCGRMLGKGLAPRFCSHCGAALK